MDITQKSTIQAIVNVFETGRIQGNYGAIAVLKGDSGHLSYGRSQTTLGSGSLAKLLERYCAQGSSQFGSQLQPFLPRFRARDFTLDTDNNVKDLLKRAGADPVMRATQDQFFSEGYLLPAIQAAEGVGITEPLGQAVVYDSHIQGGWATVKVRAPKPGAVGEREWVAEYIKQRTAWLKSLKSPLPSTTYRMDSFTALADTGNWALGLPLVVHGITITADAISGDTTGPSARVLRLITPFMKGDDVAQLQKALNQHQGFENTPDGTYGPFTDTLVKQWQGQQKINETGVGPETRKSLGL
jgi:chitosanase